MKPEKQAKYSVMKIECGWCGTHMGEKDGGGVEGTTTGICPDCVNIENLKFAQHMVLTQKISWEEAKKRAGVDIEEKA